MISEGAPCECGVELPWHLFNLGLDEHICSCERSYVMKDGTVELAGVRPNPFVRQAPAPRVRGRADTIPKKLAIMERLLDAWLAHPELRLGQLIENARPRDCDLFSIEDAELADAIDSMDES